MSKWCKVFDDGIAAWYWSGEDMNAQLIVQRSIGYVLAEGFEGAPLAGPFEVLEAAKAAYLLMWGKT